MPLHVYQSLWGMQQLPWRGGAEWTIEQQLDLVADGGFDGVCVEAADPAVERTATEAIARGLRLQVEAIPRTVDDLKPVFETVERVGRDHVDHVNLQPDVRPMTLDECIPYLLGWQAIADDAHIPLYVETHRGRMTTDLLFTLQLIDAVPTLRLTADLSHYVAGAEMALPVSAADHALVHRILDRSRAYHGRVASCEQVQIQPSFPHHSAWVELFARWWLEGFRRFRAVADADEVLVFTTELGPPSSSYAITGPDGRELSDRWAEARQLARLARTLWEEAGAQV